MTYFIIMNEWLYPTESGREFVDDVDTLEEAIQIARAECENERNNFIEVNGETYEAACADIVDENGEYCGHQLCSSQYEEENMYFQSIIIKREV